MSSFQAYLRVAAYAISFFDYLQTLPTEYRLFTRQKGSSRLSTPFILFILAFFNNGFTPTTCKKFYLAPQVFKLLLYLISQAILALRTYKVSKEALWVRIALPLLFVVVTAPELLSIFYKRISFSNNGSCTSSNPSGIQFASLFYAGALAFDVFTMATTIGYLWKFSSNVKRSFFGRLDHIMLHEGVIYFVGLAVFNTVNLILFQNTDTSVQPIAAVLGYAATMIYSSRFVLNVSGTQFTIAHIFLTEECAKL
ncbi:hypothetical protein MSAN_01071900 [Mycena sanguinolenta]|uniref:DUF6533 domain-containing protein n=1 Tax=Mycena sanguinolenta TaxID=230812 RepID=A0A8H6YMZ6_9AGAR|nr:hypothetical protein MSAN_01071900 [Mycena sanguinolenta]